MEQVEQTVPVEGNSKASTLKKSFKSRKYCFTLNNYSETEFNDIKKWCKINSSYFGIAKEIGTNGTPHLQGYIEFKNPRSFNTVYKIMKRAHIESAKGTRAQNIKYCSKENLVCKTLDFKDILKKKCLEEYKPIIWYYWQKEILLSLTLIPDKRTINWYWEPIGNSGKSFLSKYICLQYNTIIADGKKNDVFNQVNTMIEKEIIPEVIILDIPRFSNFTNYGVLEQLKNGLIYSGKYEGGQCIFPSPHIIVFSNSKPDIEMMSKDRWNIKEIKQLSCEKLRLVLAHCGSFSPR